MNNPEAPKFLFSVITLKSIVPGCAPVIKTVHYPDQIILKLQPTFVQTYEN